MNDTATILIADDHEQTVRLCAHTLEEHGYRVILAAPPWRVTETPNVALVDAGILVG